MSTIIHPVGELKEGDLRGKIVFLRGSADVPMNEEKDIHDTSRIKDASRIESFMPTLEHLIRSGARVVLQPGWIDRPDGVDKSKSVIPVFLYIKHMLSEANLLRDEMLLAPTDINGEARSIGKNFDMIKEKIFSLKDGQILVLENPRFDPEYNKGDEGYAKKLAGMMDIYVADDFAQRHRPAADIVAMPRHLPRYAGMHLMDEISYINRITDELKKDERKPFVFILAGKKIETKPGVVSKITVALKLLDRMKPADSILVGGAVAYTFMIAQEHIGKVREGPQAVRDITGREIKNTIGDSYIAKDQIQEQVTLAGRVLLKARERGIKVVLPRDHTIIKTGMLKKGEVKRSQKEIPRGWMGVDIGSWTANEFENRILKAGFVVMSGPVGMFDKKVPEAAEGSMAVARALEKATKKGVVTVSAGGESTLLVNTAGVKISHASIGGGSTLEFIEKGTLPGIDALES